MKLQKIVLTALLGAALALAGCGEKSSSSGGSQTVSVDSAPIEKNFQTADAPTKTTADSVVSQIKSSNYSGALADLQKLAANAKLTPEQQQAVKDVMAQVQKALTSAASGAADNANKAASDLQKSLPSTK